MTFVTDAARVLALALLLGRFAGVFYLRKTLRAQNKLLRLQVADDPDGEVTSFRKTLHLLTWLIVCGQFVPMVMDTYVVVTAHKVPFYMGVAYAVSNCTTALLAAILIWKIYQLADRPIEVTELEKRHIENKK